MPTLNCQPPLRAVHMSIFPTMGSLQEVVDFAESKVPIEYQNELYSLLMLYHNTLLREIGKPPKPH